MSHRVLVADDHPLLLRGLADLLQATADIEIVAIADGGAQALQVIGEILPDIAVLDVSMPDVGGMDILRTVHEKCWPVRVVILSASMTDRQIAEAVDLGVSGVLFKDFAADTLVQCLREVGRGRKWLPTDVVARARKGRKSDLQVGVGCLTRREREISEHVCRGYSNKAIAAAVGSSEGTVSIHLHHVYRKLGISNRTALATLFVRQQVHQE